MPILNVKISGKRSDAVTSSVSRMLQDHTHRILRKDPALTAIAIDYINPRDWIVGGETLAKQAKSSFYLNIKITDETNTKDEKAAYIRAVFDGFSALLGTLHEESYIHVEDVRAAAYGYGGKTQERRYHEAR